MPTVRIEPLGERKVKVVPATFLGDEWFPKYISASKRSGASYDASIRAQVAAPRVVPHLVENLKAEGFEIELTPDLRASLQAMARAAREEQQAASERLDRIDVRMAEKGRALFPFQRVGIEWLAPRKGAILADEMGLGKTIQAIGALPETSTRVLAVVPAAVKGNWASEFAIWRDDLRVSILKGRRSFRWPDEGEVVVTNYDVLPADAAEVGIECPDGVVMIADEFHAVKGSKTARTKRLRALATAVRAHGGRFWGLTGTPLLNRKNELWSLLVASGLVEETFGTYPSFERHFSYNFIDGTFTPDETVGPTLAKVMLRRVTKDVLPDLPSIRRTRVPVTDLDPEAIRLADEALQAIVRRYTGPARTTEEILDEILQTWSSSGVPAFEELSRARAALATAKIPALLELVEEYEQEGVPLVVFSDHRAPVDTLGARPGWATITGETSSEKRTSIVEEFQSGNLRGIGITVKAGGVGITLTRAWNAISVDRPWTPALQEQAEKRINRIGQDKPCLVKWLSAEHPLEARMDEILLQKMTLIDQTVEAAARHQREEGIRHEADRLSEVAEAVREGLPSEEPPVPGARRFDAKYPGKCSRCGGKTNPGDPIWYATGTVWHYVCPSSPDLPVLKVHPVVLAYGDRVLQFSTTVSGTGTVFRGPVSPEEVWAARGLLDHASLVRVSFGQVSGFESEMAARLRSSQGLSDPQWRAVIKIAVREGFPGREDSPQTDLPEEDLDPEIALDDIPF